MPLQANYKSAIRSHRGALATLKCARRASEPRSARCLAASTALHRPAWGSRQCRRVLSKLPSTPSLRGPHMLQRCTVCPPHYLQGLLAPAAAQRRGHDQPGAQLPAHQLLPGGGGALLQGPHGGQGWAGKGL